MCNGDDTGGRTMRGNRVNWAAATLLVAAATALACLVTAFLARDGQLFAAALAAGLGIGASAAYAALSLRQAEARIAKLSDELTVQSQRLMRLEQPAEPRLGAEIEAVTQATGALADELEAQAARLRALEERVGAEARAVPAAAFSVDRATSLPPHAEVLARGGAPQDEDVAGFRAGTRIENTEGRRPQPDDQCASSPAPSHLQTREDFARAASAILGRLAPEALRVVEAPSDDAVVDGLEAGLLELWLQPVVTLPQRRVRLYSALPHLQGREGQALGPEIIRPILARRRKLGRLDAFALARSLLVAGHLAGRGREGALSLALSRDAFSNPAFVDGAAGRLETDREAASRLVFEIEHGDAQTLSAQEAAALDRLRGLCAGLALAGVPSLDQDWAALARRGFGYALMDVEAVLAPRPHTTTAFLVAGAARAEVALVATGVEREPQVPDLLDFDVPLARGSALAPPRPVRAEILVPKPEPETPAAEADERTSFRDFLRRAG